MLEVTPYTSDRRQLWEAFVNTSANGTIFHTQEFLDYHPTGRFQWHHLVLGNPGVPEALLPAAIHIDEKGRRLLRSPAGASLGGPVLKPRLGLEHAVDLVRSLVEYANRQQLDGIVLGTVPAIYWPQPDDTLAFALRDAGFRNTPQLEHYVDLQTLAWPNVIESIPGARRRNFRKALKQGLQLKVAQSAQEIGEFYEILVLNKAAHRATPVHSLTEINDLQQRLGQRLRIFMAQKDGRTVAGVYCLAATPHACYTQYIADNPQDREIEGLRFVLFQMLTVLRQEGYRCLDLGPSALLPLENATLARFKESLGAVGCERCEWTLTFSPGASHSQGEGVRIE